MYPRAVVNAAGGFGIGGVEHALHVSKPCYVRYDIIQRTPTVVIRRTSSVLYLLHCRLGVEIGRASTAPNSTRYSRCNARTPDVSMEQGCIRTGGHLVDRLDWVELRYVYAVRLSRWTGLE